MDFTRRRLLAVLLAAPLAAVHARIPETAPLLTKEEEERIRKYLPRSFAKLQKRQPVVVAVCGDEINSYVAPGLPVSAANHLTAWYARFLDRLGSAFFYHGGVQDLRAPSPDAVRTLEQQWADSRKKRALWE